MINNLPIYSKVPQTFEERKEKFYKEVGPIYAKLSKMPKVEYFKLKEEFDAGDRTAIDRLMNGSIYFIVEDVVNIFARYDVAETLNIEDSISTCIERFGNYIQTFTELPDVYSKYINSIIQQYVFFTVVKEYRDEIKRAKNLDLLNDDQFRVAVDKERQYMMVDIDFEKQEFRKVLATVTKTFTPQQRNIINLYFDEINPKGCYEIAKELNLSVGRVNQLLRRCIEKIRESGKISKLEAFRTSKFKDESSLDLII